MTEMCPVEQALRTYAEAQLPRVLTQMDRDPDSPTSGCFDRNFWHYKIRDFGSAILQQGIHTLEAVRTGVIGKPLLKAAGEDISPDVVENQSLRALNALCRLVDRRGRVNEYYPFEGSYPAAAFGLYAAARVLLTWQTSAPHLLSGVQWTPLQRLARHLSGRLENQAWNQQAAGLAGLALALRVDALQSAVNPNKVAALADRFFAAQHEEGWWPEYGGPDFGYLAVTLDALYDYHDATGDARALRAADAAVAFLARITGADGRLPSTLNSRNTDYVVPYGLARAAQANPLASWLLEQFFSDSGSPAHFLWATDDRYSCHYIYASVLRALPLLKTRVAPTAPAFPEHDVLAGCGYWIVRPPGRNKTVYVAALKGGTVRIHRKGLPPVVEYGFRLRSRSNPHRVWTSNWWDTENQWSVSENMSELRVTGFFRGTTLRLPSPAAHAALRMASFLMREHLIPRLKAVLIFRDKTKRSPKTTPHFDRVVTVSPDGRVLIRDKVFSSGQTELFPGPRPHLRHVASAESFSPEELASWRRDWSGGPGGTEQDLEHSWTRFPLGTGST